jgi:hypothetical protein
MHDDCETTRQSKPLGVLGETITASWLEPRANTIKVISISDPSFEQPVVAANVLTLIRFRRDVMTNWFVAVEVPDHATARLLMRSPGADPALAIREAADAFMALPMRGVIATGFGYDGGTLILPTLTGLFLSNTIFARVEGDNGWRVSCRPRTFLAHSQAGPGQEPPEPASDPGSTVLAGSWAITDRLPGIASPFTEAEMFYLKLGLKEEPTRA